MKDLQGREYLNLSQLKIGLKIQADGGFACMAKDAIREVKYLDDGYYIECQEGRHYLDGQIAGDGVSLIGIYPEEK